VSLVAGDNLDTRTEKTASLCLILNTLLK